MKYRLSPVEINVAEGGFADFKVCNENGEQVATFGFADEHEARIARALMIRAISKAVVVVAHRTVGRQTGDRDEQFQALRQLLLSSPDSHQQASAGPGPLPAD